MTHKEALTLALALVVKGKRYADECSHMATQADIDEFDTVATAIKEALAQPAVPQGHKQEPVGLETVYEIIIQWDEGGGKRSRRELARRIVSLYTTPPQRKRVLFPTMLRRMWSGGDVQDWLDKHVNKEDA